MKPFKVKIKMDERDEWSSALIIDREGKTHYLIVWDDGSFGWNYVEHIWDMKYDSLTWPPKNAQ